MAKLFGTDGIRGMANQYPMTSEVALAVGRAAAHVLLGKAAKERKGRKPRIVVGKDTRLSGYMIENAIASGICSMGADVILIGPLPTPGVAFVTQSMRADAGIMISASHNPFDDNGIKIFSSDGFKLPDDIEDEIERLVVNSDLINSRPTGDQVGRAKRIDDVLGRYLVFLKNQFPKDLDLSGIRMVLDCANGAGYKVAPLVFEELGAEVIKKGVYPDGTNINEGCGALHPQDLQDAVLEYRADIGVALDGDGDRCILSDEKGQIVDGDQIIGLCAFQMKKDGTLKGNTVVTTPMSNMGLEVALQQSGIKMLRAQVGDRYVVEMLRKGGYNLGGEQSGHIVFLDQSTTGDGIMAALKVIEAMIRTGKKLSELKKSIKLYPQARQDVRVARKDPFEQMPDVQKLILDAETKLAGRGRVFVRYSGTESLARVMIEGEDNTEIQLLAKNIAKLLQKNLG